MHGQGKQCNGGFSDSCTDIHLVSGMSTLEASCADEDYSYQSSRLSLNERIGNINGMLVCASDQGQFSLTCTDVSLLGTSQLSAQCLDTSSIYQSTSLDLNSCVQNSNGNLNWACLT